MKVKVYRLTYIYSLMILLTEIDVITLL